ncbi:MAG: TlpA disulfide reductase family protein [Saprospiraceae bacterium]|nr:TlpA disulfide reductase family protein [Saprospiraceae bacterium]
MKDQAKLWVIALSLTFCCQSCVVIENQFSALPPGIWRAELDLSSGGVYLDNEYKRQFSRDNKLPFLFEVVYDKPDSFHIEIINGKERIILDDLTFGRNRANGRDSLKLHFPVYGTYILAYFEEDVMEGRWHVPSKGQYSIPFLARHGKGDRFQHIEQDKGFNIEGKWAVTFGIEDSTGQYPAIGEFVQNEETNEVQGTFRTETGDYRFLSGEVIGEHLWLSTFDGSHAFLFKSKITSDSTMTGFFKSGKHYETLWSASRSETAELRDPDSLTIITEEELSFDFKNEEGEVINLKSGKYEDKAKIIQVLGTWCPNCRDESVFLAEFYKEKPEDLEIIGVAFERANNPREAYQAIETYVSELGIDYDILYGGPASKSVASEKFPSLSRIIAFPTLLFLNKDNEVVRIHAGFNGPATSEFKKFKNHFYNTVESITDAE